MCLCWNHFAPFMEPTEHRCCDGAHHEEARWMLEPAPVVAGTIAHGCFERGTSMRCDDDGRGDCRQYRSCNQRQNLLEIAAKKATTACKISYYRQLKSLALLERTTGVTVLLPPCRRFVTTGVSFCYNRQPAMLELAARQTISGRQGMLQPHPFFATTTSCFCHHRRLFCYMRGRRRAPMLQPDMEKSFNSPRRSYNRWQKKLQQA